MARLININFLDCPYSKEPTAVKLDTSMTLEKIREKLSQRNKNGKSIMKSDMYFCNKERQHLIQESEEANICLHEIIGDNNNLFIKRSEKPEMATIPDHIIEDFGLLLCHGLLFDQRGLRLANKCAIQANLSIEVSSKTEPSVQLISTHRVRDTYMYANNLTLVEDDPFFNLSEPFSHFKENNPLYDVTADRAVIFRIDKELWNINLKRKDVKPTDEFVEAIKQAIEHNATHAKLDAVFSEYGYWMNCKITVGSRLQRFSQFCSEIGQDDYPKGVELHQTEWIDYLDDEILNKWSKRIHPLESDYLFSADDSLIKVEEISEWIKYSPRTPRQWSIIERADFVPTYKFLNESLIAKVEMLFSDETEILMTGESPVDPRCADLCQVNFSQPLLSDVYKIDVEVYRNGERCNVAVTLYFASIYGFSLEIEWDEFLKEVEGIYIKWKLSGNRAKIGYSDDATFQLDKLNASYIWHEIIKTVKWKKMLWITHSLHIQSRDRSILIFWLTTKLSEEPMTDEEVVSSEEAQ
ncbi:3514_t:CDS:2 [Paraglomus occultum]|uniref:3514_t:CDS:1 n=1 Tax=Paraglomus occultum TaxID=144539 RepID=A0A9N9F4J9_9GLOM|nr:3514_t:CDS:2 [Paraglomus occultum]